MQIFSAHRQWAFRPADERFSSLRELYDATKAYADVARERSVPWADLRTEAEADEVVLKGRLGQAPAALTHWSFGQLAARVGAPAGYLRDLPAALAAQNLNHGLKNRGRDDDGNGKDAQILFHTDGHTANGNGLLCRALTSDRYARIWNHEVASRLLRLEAEQGWAPARPTIRVRDENELPLYASDHDLFVFVARADLDIAEPGSDQPLLRGVIVENSEVGASALKLTSFLYRTMCGNHIIWDAEDVSDLNLRHVGRVRDRIYRWDLALRRYANQSAVGDVTKIESAQRTLIADTKEGVLDKLFGIRSLGLSRKVLEASYAAVVPDADGNPNSVWGFAQGITRYSQTIAYADKRTDLDRAAGRLLAKF